MKLVESIVLYYEILLDAMKFCWILWSFVQFHLGLLNTVKYYLVLVSATKKLSFYNIGHLDDKKLMHEPHFQGRKAVAVAPTVTAAS